MKKYGLYGLDEIGKSVVRNIDIIIIDEISMVRCDLLDEMDDVLRYYRKNNKPFGGVQLLLFGDLYQLMPVAKEEEIEQLKEHYETLNFYSSKAFKEIGCKLLELRKVYRQNNSEFINILNDLRIGINKSKVLGRISSRYRLNFNPKDEEGYIRLTTHNRRAKSYNFERLDSLPGNEYEYKAKTEGFFPSHEYPTDYVLRLKLGSRVMFVKNDNISNQYVNGTLGTVVHIDDRCIRVHVDDTNKIVWVEKHQWDFFRYRINKQTKEIYQELIGSFIQYPLKLAWAITIHKSQGLTFDKVIIDAGKAFAAGQVYVAMSRCRSLQGVVLVSEIKYNNILVSEEVTNYLEIVDKVIVADEEVDEEEMRLEAEKERVRQLPKGAIERTLWFAKDGMSLEDIVKHSGERIEIVYSHLSKLVEKGFVDVHDYLDDQKYNAIRQTINIYGVDAHLKTLKDKCPIDVKMGEVTLTVASVHHGDPEDYTHKEKVVHKHTNKDFFDDIPAITTGIADRQRNSRNVVLRKATEEDLKNATKRTTIFISSNDSKKKDIDRRLREQKIINAAYEANGGFKPKLIVNYQAMSSKFGGMNNIIVSAREGYYIKSEHSRYYYLTALKLENPSGSIYVSKDKQKINSFEIFHTSLNGTTLKIGEVSIANNFFTFRNDNGQSITRRMV